MQMKQQSIWQELIQEGVRSFPDTEVTTDQH